MFAYTGMTPAMCDELTAEHDGRTEGPAALADDSAPFCLPGRSGGVALLHTQERRLSSAEARRRLRSPPPPAPRLRPSYLATTTRHNIFLTRDGRISLAGINDANVEKVAQAIQAVTKGKALG